MIEKLIAIFLALVLSLGAVTAYAQDNDTSVNNTDVEPQVCPPLCGNDTEPEPAVNVTATDIQIQLVPNIQRGHNQHVTLYAVDDAGKDIAGATIQGEVTNEAGNNVGLGEFNSTTGEDKTFKVGPNTRPQNITISAELAGTNVTDSEQYSVFAKPKPVENTTEPVTNQTGNTTTPTPTPEPEPTPTNQTGNATTGFEQLDNSTAILEQEIEAVDNDGNETDRANMKEAISETANGIGEVADLIVNATNEQLQSIQAGANAITDAIDLLID